MKGTIRIVVVGDDGVGKSSLISTYISRVFPEEISKLASDSHLASEISNGVEVHIMDTSNDPGDEEVRKLKMCLADCIVVLYDVSRLNTLTNIATKWMPLIQQIYQEKLIESDDKNKLRVLLCGTKTDLPPGNSKDLEDEVRELNELFATFPMIVSSFKCSAKSLDSQVESVFYHAELAVNYPISPLYDIYQSTFTGQALVCFLRVFRIFDRDSDGVLNDSEFRSMHGKCFFENDDTEVRRDSSLPEAARRPKRSRKRNAVGDSSKCSSEEMAGTFCTSCGIYE